MQEQRETSPSPSSSPFAQHPLYDAAASTTHSEAVGPPSVLASAASTSRTPAHDAEAASVMSHWADGEPLQRRTVGRTQTAPDLQATAALGRSGPASTLPFLSEIQRSFGPQHSVQATQAYLGHTADLVTQKMGAEAYATGSSVVFGSQPTLFTAAHEAAHVIQQRRGVSLPGGAGSAGDAYERHADAVAERVVAGQSAADLLDEYAVEGATSGAHGEGSREGAVQLRKKPEIASTQKAMGQHVADGMERLDNSPHGADTGVHYAHNYKSNYPRRWKDDWWDGYADPHYFQHNGFMSWSLKPGRSASAAIKQWLKGLTIAECLTAIIAVQIDTMRAALGDERFDEMYGSSDQKKKPKKHYLAITTEVSQTPLANNMKDTESAKKHYLGTPGHRPAKKGEWHYMYNHPQYLLKHPGGAWQGENMICMGEDADGNQLWSGFGAQNKTEDQMLNEMVLAYNADRDARDDEILRQIKADHGGKLPRQYDPASHEFPQRISKKDILSAPAYTLDGTTRKGGFLPEAGNVLDPQKITDLK